MRGNGPNGLLQAALVALGSILPVDPISAQVTTELDALASCSECSIDATVVLSLRDQDRPIVGQPSGFAHLADGSWLLAHSDDAGRIMVFNSSGVFERAIGRTGKGPGEFTTASRMTVGGGDSLRVLDWATGRWSVFDPELEFVRAFRTPRMDVQNAVTTLDGRMVVAGHLAAADLAGLPLHLVRPDGEFVRSFGTTNRSFRSDRRHGVARFVALEADTAVWSVDINQYRLQLWSLNGKLLREIRREVDWFPSWEESTPRHERDKTPPVARTMGIRRDSVGLIWVMIRVAGSNWKDAVGPTRDPYGRPTLGILDENQYYDTVVEVIDPQVGSVIATSRIQGWLRLLAPDGYAPQYLEDEIGVPELRIWRLQLPRS